MWTNHCLGSTKWPWRCCWKCVSGDMWSASSHLNTRSIHEDDAPCHIFQQLYHAWQATDRFTIRCRHSPANKASIKMCCTRLQSPCIYPQGSGVNDALTSYAHTLEAPQGALPAEHSNAWLHPLTCAPLPVADAPCVAPRWPPVSQPPARALRLRMVIRGVRRVLLFIQVRAAHGQGCRAYSTCVAMAGALVIHGVGVASRSPACYARMAAACWQCTGLA